MYPGTLVPNICHFKEVFVDSCVGQCFLEKRLMGLWRAGCYNYPGQALFFYYLGYLVLCVLRATEHVVLYIDNPGQAL